MINKRGGPSLPPLSPAGRAFVVLCVLIGLLGAGVEIAAMVAAAHGGAPWWLIWAVFTR